MVGEMSKGDVHGSHTPWTVYWKRVNEKKNDFDLRTKIWYTVGDLEKKKLQEENNGTYRSE